MRHLPAMFRSGPIGLPAHHDRALRAARPEGSAFQNNYNWLYCAPAGEAR